MCVLVIGIGVHPQHHVFVAANRDEMYARSSTPPEVERRGTLTVLAPRDTRAGGSWEGVNETGLIVVITNRLDGDYDDSRASRGALCREALELSHADDVRDWIESAVGARRFNSFNLFYADARAAYVSSWNGTLTTQPLTVGIHVLSNRHALGELIVPELGGLPSGGSALREHLIGVLSSHEPRNGGDFRICKHGERYGTVSSSLLYAHQDAGGVIEYAAGPPCETGFATFALTGPP